VLAEKFPKTPNPKPARIHSPDPFLRAGKFSRGFAKSFSPENSFGKTESALVPPPARILVGQNTKEKCPFLFRRNRSRANPKSKEHFSLVSAEALRGGGGADSFVQFPLEKSSRKVYNYSTINASLYCVSIVPCSNLFPKTLNEGEAHAPRAS